MTIAALVQKYSIFNQIFVSCTMWICKIYYKSFEKFYKKQIFNMSHFEKIWKIIKKKTTFK